MRSPNASVLTALQSGKIVARDFIYIVAKNRDTGLPEPVGFWTDIGTVTVPVIDALTLATVNRTFHGSGTIGEIDDVPLTTDLTVRSVRATLSHIDSEVEEAIRGYETKGCPVQIYRGLFDPATRALIDAAVPRFVGFISTLEIRTPKEGEDGSATIAIVSHMREMTRSSTETRSDASQRRRTGGADRLFKFAGVAQNWTIFWGQKHAGKAKTGKGRRKNKRKGR